MAKRLIHHVSERLKSYPAKVFLVANNDSFLARSDVQDAFAAESLIRNIIKMQPQFS